MAIQFKFVVGFLNGNDFRQFPLIRNIRPEVKLFPFSLLILHGQLSLVLTNQSNNNTLVLHLSYVRVVWLKESKINNKPTDAIIL